jgi:tripartite-type tricarboxylate transporter receptor subunit TctC
VLAPAVTDLLGGQVQLMFVTTVSSIEYKTGRLRALAVTTATKNPEALAVKREAEEHWGN